MRVLLIADADFAYREHAMLRRLQVGLFDEGIVALQAHARSTPEIDQVEAATDILHFQDAGPSLTLSIRARRLVRDLEERADAPGSDDRLIDVVHAFGRESWPMARAVARETGAALCCELFALALVPRIGAAESAAARALGAAGTPFAWCCSDPGLVNAVEEASSKAKVRMIPWGVHVPAEVGPPRQPGRALALAILADPESPDHPGALLDALAAFDPDAQGLPAGARERAEAETIMTTPTGDGDASEKRADDDDDVDPWTELPDRPMLFIDEGASAWLQRAGRLDTLSLRERISLVPNAEAHRSLALRCDALILPTSTGMCRSLVLEAMASGVRVLAAGDSAIDILRDGQTAFVAQAASPDGSAWSALLSRAFPEAGAGENPLAEQARALLRAERLASDQVAELINLYGELAGPPPAIAFDSGGDGSASANS